MYISLLLINVGENPDHPRPGRLWLRNLYRVHQRLCMAFPSDSRKTGDPSFLKPFKLEDFGHGQIHVARGSEAGFLYRIDPHPGGRVLILVQSAVKPDWAYAFHNAGYLLAAPPEVKQYFPSFSKGQHFRFRLLANPTRKIDTKSYPDGRRNNGNRVPVPAGQLVEWLARHAEPAGFSIDSLNVQPSYIFWNKPRNGNGQRMRSARYDGVLRVTEPEHFQEILARGIGPGKAFGFGLLSIAPL